MIPVIRIDASQWPAAANYLPALTGHFNGRAGGSPPPVRVIDGSRRGWCAEAVRAVSSVDALLVADPSLSADEVSVQELEKLARDARDCGTALIVGDPWIAASSLDSIRREWAKIDGDDVVLVDATASANSGSGVALILTMLSAIHAGLGVLPSLRAFVTHGNAELLAGRASFVRNDGSVASVPLMARSARRAGEPSCTITIVLRQGAVTWTLPALGDAAPSTVQISGPSGTLLVPTVYESPYRQALLRAYAAAVAAGGSAVSDEVSPLIEVRRHLDSELRRLGSPVPAPPTSPTNQLLL